MTAFFQRLWQGRIARLSFQAVWVMAVVLLPITSLPLINQVTHSTVGPPTAFLLLAMAGLWLVPYIFWKGAMPVECVPFLWWVGVVVISWLMVFFQPLPALRDQTPLTEGLSAFVTLALGIAVFLVTATWLRANPQWLPITLRLLNWSGLVLLAWNAVQAVVVLAFDGDFPFPLIQFQWLFSSRDATPLFYNRVTGFAYEPSWLAHQLNLVYLPLWLSATLQGFSAHRWRLWRITFENMLLLGGVAMLVLSFSRVGWISFGLMVMVATLGITWWIVQRIQVWLFPRLRLSPRQETPARVLLSLALLLTFIAGYVAAMYGLVRVGARIDDRLEHLLTGEWLAAGDVYAAANQLAFAERVVYWGAGFDIFGDHLWLGTGLGNAGFYFPSRLPNFGWGLVEISDLFNRLPFIPNVKSMWVRILAETGLVGFAVFWTWYYLLGQSAQQTRRSPQKLFRTLGVAGLFMLAAFLVEGFSVDSFALPYFWFAAGLLVAARLPESGAETTQTIM